MQNDLLVRKRILKAFFAFCMAFAVILHPDAKAQSLVIEGKDNWLFPGWESLTEDNREGIDRSISLIKDTKTSLSRAGIKLIVLIVPMKGVVYKEDLPPSQLLSDAVLHRYGYIQSALKNADIPSIDLNAVLAEVKERQPVFYRTDYHWTTWAAEAAATALANQIQKIEGKKGELNRLKSEKWIEEKRFGDLANLTSRERRRQLGEEKFMIRQRGPSGGLLDDIPAKVQVIGNSFVQPYLGFTQALSDFLGEKVGLSWNYGDVGPWVTLMQFVRSEEFKKAAPRLVIWQFNEGQLMNGPDAAGLWMASSLIAPDQWLIQLNLALKR